MTFFKYLPFIFSLFLLISCKDTEEKKDIPKVDETLVKIDQNSLTAIEQAIIENPESPNAYTKRSYYYAKKGDYKKAIADINRALTITPNVASLNFTKAELLFNQAGSEQNPLLYDQSEIYLENTIKLDSLYTDAHILMAKIAIGKKSPEKVFKYLSNAIHISPTLSEPYFLKGLTYQKLGNFQLAQSSYQTALEMDGQNYDANVALGYIYYLDTNANGLIYFDAASVINPNLIEPIRNKGLLLVNLGEPMKAMKSFEKVLEIDSTFEEAYYNIGVCYINSYNDDFPKEKQDSIVNNAIKNFKIATDINPNYAQAWYNLGHSYEFSGDRKNALECYKKAIDLQPDFELVNDALRRF